MLPWITQEAVVQDKASRLAIVIGTVVKVAAKILSHLGRWDRNFPHPTFFEVGGIENFPIPLLSRQVG